MDYISALAALADALSGLGDSLDKAPERRRRAAARGLVALHKRLEDLVLAGNQLVLHLEALTPDRAVLPSGLFAFQLYRKPLGTERLLCALQTTAELTELSRLLDAQGRRIRAIRALLATKQLRNLGIILDAVPSIHVSLTEKFGSVTMILSRLGTTVRLPNDLKGTRPELLLKYLSSDDPKLETRHRGFLRSLLGKAWRHGGKYYLVYMPYDITRAKARLRDLQRHSRGLKKLIRTRFPIEDVL